VRSGEYMLAVGHDQVMFYSSHRNCFMHVFFLIVGPQKFFRVDFNWVNGSHIYEVEN
jgi:hypothetical protein